MNTGVQCINMDMRSNVDRAACAGRILDAEEAYSQSINENEPDTAIVDLLADLMHWYKGQGFTSPMGGFSDLVRIAGQHFEDEVLAEKERNCWSYPMEDWQAEVIANNTRLGYWEWVKYKQEEVE